MRVERWAVVRWVSERRAAWLRWKSAPAACRALEIKLAREREYSAALGAKLNAKDGRIRELERGDLREPPSLTAAEIERLAMLQEACGAVIRAASRVLRHGYESVPPRGGVSSRVQLERELGDLGAVLELLHDSADTRSVVVNSWRKEKRASLRKWTHHQPCSTVGGQKGVGEGESICRK